MPLFGLLAWLGLHPVRSFYMGILQALIGIGRIPVTRKEQYEDKALMLHPGLSKIRIQAVDVPVTSTQETFEGAFFTLHPNTHFCFCCLPQSFLWFQRFKLDRAVASESRPKRMKEARTIDWGGYLILNTKERALSYAIVSITVAIVGRKRLV